MINIGLTPNDPVKGLLEQANQLKNQAKAHSKYDNDGISWNNEKTNIEEQPKLFVPETFKSKSDKIFNYKNWLIISFLILLIYLLAVFQ